MMRGRSLVSGRVPGRVFLVGVLVASLLQGGAAATAEDAVERVVDPQVAREEAVYSLLWGGPSERRAAQAALLGTPEDAQELLNELYSKNFEKFVTDTKLDGKTLKLK